MKLLPGEYVVHQSDKQLILLSIFVTWYLVLILYQASRLAGTHDIHRSNMATHPWAFRLLVRHHALLTGPPSSADDIAGCALFLRLQQTDVRVCLPTTRPPVVALKKLRSRAEVSPQLRSRAEVRSISLNPISGWLPSNSGWMPSNSG